jgi:hypothetical protein
MNATSSVDTYMECYIPEFQMKGTGPGGPITAKLSNPLFRY